MSAKSFRAKLGAKGHSLFFEVPLDVRKEFGKARPPVKVTINGYTYRSTVSVYGGKYYLPVRQERRDEAGLKGGQIIDVKIALDTADRHPAARTLHGVQEECACRGAVGEAQLHPQERARRRHLAGQETRNPGAPRRKDFADAGGESKVDSSPSRFSAFEFKIVEGATCGLRAGFG